MPVNLDKLAELMAGATKGPWQVTHIDGTISAYADDGCWSADVYDPDGQLLRQKDAALIVAAVNALPDLLALQAEADRMRGALEKAREFAVMYLAFVGRDVETDRLDDSLDRLTELAKETDAIARKALEGDAGS